MLEEIFSGTRPAAHEEAVIEPELPIVDAHHHLLDFPGFRYLFDEIRADVESGHNILSTVYVECSTMYRNYGPQAERPLGEVEFATGIAAMSASGNYGPTKICDGVVGYADLKLGGAVEEILEAQLCIAGTRFKGIRKIAFYDPDPIFNTAPFGEDMPGILQDSRFLEGFAKLLPFGLSFDVCVYFTQLDDVRALARRHPETPIIVNHIGVPLGVAAYAGRRDEIFATWSENVRRVAAEPNTYIKLGGLGTPHLGAGYHRRKVAASSEELARDWRPYFETCIEAFGTNRCMFEGNAPVDLGASSYRVIWNAFKRICAGASAAEKDDLFRKTASTVYRLDADCGSSHVGPYEAAIEQIHS
jgi:L-fuconolactonase